MLFERVGKEVSRHRLPSLSSYFEEDEDYYVEELVEARKLFLTNLTEADIVNVEPRGRVFTDDHELCINVDITFATGDVLSFGVWWADEYLIGAFLYSDSKKAMKEILDYLKDGWQ